MLQPFSYSYFIALSINRILYDTINTHTIPCTDISKLPNNYNCIITLEPHIKDRIILLENLLSDEELKALRVLFILEIYAISFTREFEVI